MYNLKRILFLIADFTWAPVKSIPPVNPLDKKATLSGVLWITKSARFAPLIMKTTIPPVATAKKYETVKEYNIFTPYMIRFGQFIISTSHLKGIESIKGKSEAVFIQFMHDKKQVTVEKGKLAD
ncbi:hypothetical protein [Maribellus maritimus]|uniref:hypothetical protein n=1 Tax=Maribellus maritimus TaxID=2870838 RepID=UPI001EE9E397|nr:hypothetical protein [Maribellus maritimus]MCG6188107.1 hypothetical protein [Maribellus maritimus]